MRVSRAILLAAFSLALASTKASAQRWDDSFKWYIGGQGGLLAFETPAQTRGWVPSVGGSLLVVAKRSGLLISVDEALGSEEHTGYSDVNANAGVRDVTFDRIRKYSAILTGYPIRGHTQPYFGVGFGLLQVVNPQPGGFFTSPVQARLAKQLADNKSTDGFISFVAGVQFRLGRAVAFGQYQLSSSPTSGHLLQGPSHAVNGGLRFSLGGAKEGIHGGGY